MCIAVSCLCSDRLVLNCAWQRRQTYGLVWTWAASMCRWMSRLSLLYFSQKQQLQYLTPDSTRQQVCSSMYSVTLSCSTNTESVASSWFRAMPAHTIGYFAPILLLTVALGLLTSTSIIFSFTLHSSGLSFCGSTWRGAWEWLCHTCHNEKSCPHGWPQCALPHYSSADRSNHKVHIWEAPHLAPLYWRPKTRPVAPGKTMPLEDGELLKTKKPSWFLDHFISNFQSMLVFGWGTLYLPFLYTLCLSRMWSLNVLMLVKETLQ